MNYSITGAWLCHAGQVRRVNEDACLAAGNVFSRSNGTPGPFNVPGGDWIVAVADGIGGHQAGAEASYTVVEGLAKCTKVTPVGVRDTLEKLNKDLCKRGSENPEYEGMGTTIAGLACGPKGIFVFHVGDSRVYRQEGNKLVQLTRDDSEAEELMEIGLLPPDTDIRPGFLHALTQAIGGRTDVVPITVHTQPQTISEKTRFLICSDGLTDMVARSSMEQVFLLNETTETTAAGLFQLAMDAGGMDNITIAVIDVEPIPAKKRARAQS